MNLLHSISKQEDNLLHWQGLQYFPLLLSYLLSYLFLGGLSIVKELSLLYYNLETLYLF